MFRTWTDCVEWQVADCCEQGNEPLWFISYGELLTSWGTFSFSRVSLLCGVSCHDKLSWYFYFYTNFVIRGIGVFCLDTCFYGCLTLRPHSSILPQCNSVEFCSPRGSGSDKTARILVNWLLADIHQLFAAPSVATSDYQLAANHRNTSELAIAVSSNILWCVLENRQQGGSARAVNRTGRMFQQHRPHLRMPVTLWQKAQVWTRPYRRQTDHAVLYWIREFLFPAHADERQ